MTQIPKAPEKEQIVMQRLHVDDLAGHLIEQGGWTVLKLPARAEVDVAYEIDDGKAYTLKAGELLHPARLGQQELDERRRSMGTAAFYAQYMLPLPCRRGSTIGLSATGARRFVIVFSAGDAKQYSQSRRLTIEKWQHPKPLSRCIDFAGV